MLSLVSPFRTTVALQKVANSRASVCQQQLLQQQQCLRRTSTSNSTRRPLVPTRKHFSSSSSSGAAQPPPTATTTTSTGTAGMSPHALRQQRAEERAKRMQNEIESIMKKHDHRHEDEAKKRLRLAGFMEFLGNNKTNLSIIVVSFLTVVLGVKLVQGKQRYRELEQEMKETQKFLDEKRTLLKTIISPDFQSTLANRCASEWIKFCNDAAAAESSKKGRLFGWTTTKTSSSSSRDDDMEAVLSLVLTNDLNTLVGDAAFTEDEKNAKDLKELQVDDDGHHDDGTTIQRLRALSESSSNSSSSVSSDGTADANNSEEWMDHDNASKDGKGRNLKSVFRI